MRFLAKDRELGIALNLRLLSRASGMPMCFARGVVESIRAITAIHFRDHGDIGRWSNEDIALTIEYPGDPDALIALLVEYDFLQESEAHRLVLAGFPDRSTRNRRARSELSRRVRFTILKRDDFTCQYCGAQPPDATLHVDHIRPISRGGGNESENLVTACADCNSGKGAALAAPRGERL